MPIVPLSSAIFPQKKHFSSYSQSWLSSTFNSGKVLSKDIWCRLISYEVVQENSDKFRIMHRVSGMTEQHTHHPVTAHLVTSILLLSPAQPSEKDTFDHLWVDLLKYSPMVAVRCDLKYENSDKLISLYFQHPNGKYLQNMQNGKKKKIKASISLTVSHLVF